MKATLLVMTLNEIDGMKAVMPRIDKNWCQQIIVVDGGSTDGTVEWAIENGYRIYVQKQQGIRNAYMEIWPEVTGDIVITFSPDGNSIPELIPALIAEMAKGFDMVIVSRYLGNAKSYDDDLLTAFGNWLFTKTVNLLHGGRYTDAMVIYRAYRKQVVYELGLDRDDAYRLPERLFRTKVSWEPLLSVRALKADLKLAEIPGDEPLRIGGERKLQVFRWGAAFYLQFIMELWFWKAKPGKNHECDH
ncbi:MAG: glycosyltransferase family 2 protein [Pseudomonadota bacterium]